METIQDLPISTELSKLQSALLSAKANLYDHKDGYIYVVIHTKSRHYKSHHVVNNALIANEHISYLDEYNEESCIYTNNPDTKNLPYFDYSDVNSVDDLVAKAKEDYPVLNSTRRRRTRRRRRSISDIQPDIDEQIFGG